MTAAAIVSDLSAMGVRVVCPEPGRIKLVASTGEVPTEAVTLARPHKAALLELLKPLACSPHNNPANYVDATAGGRVRTTCRVCGRFIGYRPTNDPTQQTRYNQSRNG